jgi:hypothetical protein
MTTFPGSPRLIKGALVSIDPLIPIPNVIVFQYSPDTLTRRLEARAVGQEGDRGEAFRLTGAPKETITLSVEIDAADQLERGDPLAGTVGLHPTLAALETMLYPKSAIVIANDVLAALGTVEVIPAEAPMILFVWGPARVLPVRITSFSITEEAYDPLLNPLRAKVELTLTVLSYQDLALLSPGYAMFLAHHVAKEVLALSNVVNSVTNIGVGLKL